MKNIGLVGLGKWGKILLDEFDKKINVSICVTTGNKKNISWLKKHYPDISHSTNYDELLQNNSIDAVIIATPIDTHYELIKNALKHKKHVFTEKPLSDTLSKVKFLESLAKRNKVILFVGHIFIYHPVLQKIKHLLKDDNLQYFSMTWNKFGSFKENIILNLVSHDLSILLELFGMPKKLSKIYSKGIISNIDMINLQVNYSKTFNGIITINRVSDHKLKSISIISKKHFLIWNNNDLYKLNTKTKKFYKIFHSNKTSLTIEVSEFIKTVKSNKNSTHNLQISRDTLKLVSKLMN